MPSCSVLLPCLGLLGLEASFVKWTWVVSSSSETAGSRSKKRAANIAKQMVCFVGDGARRMSWQKISATAVILKILPVFTVNGGECSTYTKIQVVLVYKHLLYILILIRMSKPSG